MREIELWITNWRCLRCTTTANNRRVRDIRNIPGKSANRKVKPYLTHRQTTTWAGRRVACWVVNGGRWGGESRFWVFSGSWRCGGTRGDTRRRSRTRGTRHTRPRIFEGGTFHPVVSFDEIGRQLGVKVLTLDSIWTIAAIVKLKANYRWLPHEKWHEFSVIN